MAWDSPTRLPADHGYRSSSVVKPAAIIALTLAFLAGGCGGGSSTSPATVATEDSTASQTQVANSTRTRPVATSSSADVTGPVTIAPHGGRGQEGGPAGRSRLDRDEEERVVDRGITQTVADCLA